MNDLTLPIQPKASNDSQTVKVLAVNPMLAKTNSATKPSDTIKPKSAKRLAETKSLSHQDWLAVRNQGIGGSDSASACGLNPYMSRLELWLIKTGRINADLSDELIENAYSPLYWGKELEPLIAKYYTAKTGNKVRRVNAVLQHPDPDKSFMLANLDYAVNKSEVGVLEIKTAGEHGAKLWKDGVPLYVICQVQHQLAVTGKQLAHVCVLICGHEAKLFEVKRDDLFIEQLIEQERRFWDYVQQDIAPPADGSDSSAKALQQLYSTTYGEAVDFSDNDTVNEWFTQLKEQKELVDKHQHQFDFFKQQIQQAMKQAEFATFATGSVSWKKSKDSISLDSKALLADKPELLERYSQVKQGSRRFLVNAK
ncbi:MULTISPECIES: YqaJ viral recombinase family protein [unclassified Moraxella]|uniref:YqaJ viral recombinase family nuclease n=1 Tax=unclassified Moraxella TaxID=2685852 RepID=UPI003AF71082